jgi:plastocyanin
VRYFGPNNMNMRTTTTLFTLLPFAIFAQTTWNVEVGGSLSDPNNLPYYDPMELVINVGDIVTWTNVQGSHNVNGQLNLFPNNPAGFGNGQAAGAPWTFSHTFTLAGDYEYHCTVTFQGQAHSTTQHGMITVVQTQNVTEQTDLGALSLFPVPAGNVITIELDGGELVQADVIGVDGRLVRSTPLTSVQRAVISLEGIRTGRYFLRLTDRSGRTLVRPFVKD